MKKKCFTLVEIMIAISISTIVFAVVLSTVVQLSYMVRDSVASYTLTEYSRMARHAITSGIGGHAGLGSAQGDTIIDSRSLTIRNFVGTDLFEYGASDFQDTTITIDNHIDVAGNTILPPSLEIDDDIQVTLRRVGQNVDIIYTVKREYMGKKFVLTSTIRSVVNDYEL